ncbi:MAG: hypothetical protein HRT88_16580, partial [Lentisphaeraceae bacterium]|nr:hypothetical protein [Lentisphaeraceae bacterium]
AILEHLSRKLPVSRLQRDLTDSTVLRNVGVPLAHMLISMKSLTKGLNKLILNQDEINRDLDNNWAVAAEGIQTVLKREGYPKPYEALKELTRKNSHVNQESLGVFIDGLNITDALKTELKLITPHSRMMAAMIHTAMVNSTQRFWNLLSLIKKEASASRPVY